MPVALIYGSKLDLLGQLYTELLIPEAVWREIVIKGAGQPGADEIKAALWIKPHLDMLRDTAGFRVSNVALYSCVGR